MPDLLQEIDRRLKTLLTTTYPDGRACHCNAGATNKSCDLCGEYQLLKKCRDKIISLTDDGSSGDD